MIVFSYIGLMAHWIRLALDCNVLEVRRKARMWEEMRGRWRSCWASPSRGSWRTRWPTRSPAQRSQLPPLRILCLRKPGWYFYCRRDIAILQFYFTLSDHKKVQIKTQARNDITYQGARPSSRHKDGVHSWQLWDTRERYVEIISFEVIWYSW